VDDSSNLIGIKKKNTYAVTAKDIKRFTQAID